MFCVVDVLIGLALLFRVKLRAVALIQLLMVAGYSIVLSLLLPELWLHPFGPLLKNLPIIVAIIAWSAIEDER